MRRNWTPSIVPTASRDDQTIYLVVNNFRNLGIAFAETDVEQANLQNRHHRFDVWPVRRPRFALVAVNTAEHWAEDVSEDIAREIQRRVDLAGDELPFSIEAFIEMHAGPSRQLSLRLN
jgi:hypothetical protein